MTNQKKQSTEAAVREIRRRTRRKFSPEEKIRNVMHAAPSPRLDHPVTKGRGVSRRIDTNGAFRSPPLGSLLGHFGTKSPNWTRYSEGVSP